MTALRHIIAATDLSAPSLLAVDRGYQLAEDNTAAFTLITAAGIDALAPLRAFLGGERGDVLEQEILARERDALAEVAADPARNRGVAASLRVEPGSASAAIADYVDEMAPDLVVVGAHGKGFLNRFIFGSTASRLVRKSHCPVLVVRNPCLGAYRRLLVAVDFSPASTLALELARKVAPEAEILLLHVFEVPFEGMLSYSSVRNEVIDQYRTQARDDALARLRDMAAAAGLERGRFTVVAEQGEAGTRLSAVEDQFGCDLVLLGKHGQHVVEELLLGSLTSRVLAESRADVLVVTDARRAARPDLDVYVDV